MTLSNMDAGRRDPAAITRFVIQMFEENHARAMFFVDIPRGANPFTFARQFAMVVRMYIPTFSGECILDTWRSAVRVCRETRWRLGGEANMDERVFDYSAASGDRAWRTNPASSTAAAATRSAAVHAARAAPWRAFLAGVK